MSDAFLEHANITVSDPNRTAQMLHDIFGWHIRWQGDSIDSGQSIHVGGQNSYLALYKQSDTNKSQENSYKTIGGLNHLAVVVDDLEATKRKAVLAGCTMGEHYDYEPGERFYFHDHDNLEYEVVCYDKK